MNSKTYYIETKDDRLEVDFFGEVTMQENGIGSYEYWGFNYYHSDIRPTCEEFTWDKGLYTGEQNDEIEKFAQDNCESILEALEEQGI